MGQLFLHLGAYVHLQKTITAPSAWVQLGFEEGCLQDTDCLIFTAAGEKGAAENLAQGQVCAGAPGTAPVLFCQLVWHPPRVRWSVVAMGWWGRQGALW